MMTKLIERKGSILCLVNILLTIFLILSSIKFTIAQSVFIPYETLNIDNTPITGKEFKVLRDSILERQKASVKREVIESIYHCDPHGGLVSWSPDSVQVFPSEFNNVVGLDSYLMYNKDYFVPLRCDTLTKNGNDIGLYDAYKAGWMGNENFIVAIIGSGLTSNYDINDGTSSFENRFWWNVDERSDNGIDDDNNGYVDDSYRGYSFADSIRYLVDNRNNYHGTHMSHIIAAPADGLRPGFGIDQHSKIMILKADSEDGSYSISTIAEAVRYAVDNGAKVINISVSLPTPIPTEQKDLTLDYDLDLTSALNYAWTKGAIIVSGVGDLNGSGLVLEKSHYNQIANHPAVVAVGSIHTNLVSFLGAFSYTGKKNDSVTFSYVAGSDTKLGGTSSSAAFLSSMISVYWGANSHLRNFQVKKAILDAARDQIFDAGDRIKNILIKDRGDSYHFTRELCFPCGNVLPKFHAFSRNDIKGWDEAYGYGLLSFTELVNGVKYRDVTVDVWTGAVNGYTRPIEVLEEDYDLFELILSAAPSESSERTLKIYPNPAVDFINIKGINEREFTVKVFDIMGHIKKTEELQTNIYIGDLLPGIYWIEVVDNLHKSITKFIKL